MVELFKLRLDTESTNPAVRHASATASAILQFNTITDNGVEWKPVIPYLFILIYNSFHPHHPPSPVHCAAILSSTPIRHNDNDNDNDNDKA